MLKDFVGFQFRPGFNTIVTTQQRPVSSSSELEIFSKDFLSPESLYRDMTGGLSPIPYQGLKDHKLDQQSGTSNVFEESIKEEPMSKYQVSSNIFTYYVLEILMAGRKINMIIIAKF